MLSSKTGLPCMSGWQPWASQSGSIYGRPGISQRTSKRLNALIKGELLVSGSIDIYVAIPHDLDWNGLPVHSSAGLGLIKKYALPWNMRSAG